MSSGIISVCCGNTPHIEHAQKKNLFTLAGYACAERRPSVLCQVEADGCDRAKNHLYSGIHGDTVSTRLLSLDSRLVCWISGSLVFVRIFFFFSPCFLFFFMENKSGWISGIQFGCWSIFYVGCSQQAEIVWFIFNSCTWKWWLKKKKSPIKREYLQISFFLSCSEDESLWLNYQLIWSDHFIMFL